MTEQVDEWARGLPSEPLRPYVGFWSGYRQRGMPPSRHRGLPSPWLTVIVTLDEPLHVAEHPDPAQPGDRFDTLVGGLHTCPATIVSDGAQSGVQIGLSPRGHDVLGPLAARLREALAGADTWPARFAALDAMLLRRLRAAQDRGGTGPPPAVRPELGHAWTAILRSGGAVRVEALAREVGWSTRHLREAFTRELGLSPKEAARVVRFDLARRRYQAAAARGEAPVLADVAVRAGYYDQSHLDRDFRRFAGVPPTRWLADELRNVQVPPGVDEEAWSA